MKLPKSKDKERFIKVRAKLKTWTVVEDVIEFDTDVTKEEALAWLEKQDKHANTRININENKKMLNACINVLRVVGHSHLADWLERQRTADKIEPKFKVGDLIKHNKANIICKVISVNSGSYYVENIETSGRIELFNAEQNFHLWTINDANDGDLIYVSTETMGIQAIFHKFENGIIYFHCNLCSDFTQGGYEPSGDVQSVNPLPKTHYQRFFRKMKEAGYEWRQEEKKLIKINESKFKVGDWVILNGTVAQILDKQKYGFVGLDIDGKDFFCNYGHTDSMHLWTINDAKDGDVLVNGSNIFIFHFINDTRLMGYCHVNNGRFYDDIGRNECFCLIDAIVTPATKEQRELLFAEMKEAGYEWNTENKELKKIESKMLDADKVIEWMKHRELSCDDVVITVIPDDSPTSVPHRVKRLSDEFIKQFKKDFRL